MSPAVQPEIAEEHWAKQIYELMVLRGVDPHDMVPNFEDGKGSHVVLAMPVAKVALATEGDVFDGLAEDGWTITHIPVGAMKSFASTSRELASLAVDYKVRLSSSELIKLGSEDEARLLNGILRAHLPPPDRNYRIMREDNPGQELTVPDFTWPKHRVAFFVDGLWWHHGKDSDLQRKMRTGVAESAVIDEAERQQVARATRDASNRSDLTLMGWTVLWCSDEDVADDGGVLRQVERIKKALKGALGKAPETVVATTTIDTDDGGDDLDDLLDIRV